ncbi:hypothetical protein DAPPUDRAFT_247036 [Daphnia pulex]|uniref:Uncharacterized protein n=1 Tax=Daphnia pulex TaxID=6669 RepID=E9GRN1_DAPPU|nr:hypothetical protein DAPPUDRAFT_247036 [Daphnia pulex]|eukprot:EFX77882.1 hypothetical protein DAPPUDRAFT_247036 [Daphnia pulex]
MGQYQTSVRPNLLRADVQAATVLLTRYLPSSARAPICACHRMVTPPTRRDFAYTHFLIGELALISGHTTHEFSSQAPKTIAPSLIEAYRADYSLRFRRWWIGSDARIYKEKMEEPEAGWLKGRKEESKEGWAREGASVASCSSSGGSSASAPEERTKERKHQSWHTSHAVLPISSGRFRLDFLARVEVAAAARALPAIKDSRLMGRGSDSLPSDNNSRRRRRRRRVLLLHESNATTEAYSLLLSPLHLH